MITARTLPASLVSVPERDWPARRGRESYPVAVWASRYYLVQRYDEPALNGVELRRLTVSRTSARTLNGQARWDQDIPWEDLQRCKRETGHGDWYGLELYPRDRDVVNVANMRHLWLLAEPLGIGWFR